MQAYLFKHIQTVSVSRDFFLFVHTYSFKTRFNKRYIVQVEEYAHEVFIIKFYLKSHSRSKYKYSKLANDFDGFRVLSTCITIMLTILESKECASFGFLGANAENEPIANNQRYRIYRHLMQRYFSPAHFLHALNEETSAYLIINRLHQQPEQVLSNLETYFTNYYTNL